MLWQLTRAREMRSVDVASRDGQQFHYDSLSADSILVEKLEKTAVVEIKGFGLS